MKIFAVSFRYMADRFEVRDWEVNEAIMDMTHDSYDLVGRGFPVGGFEADFLRYRKENYLVEAGFFYDAERGKGEAMEQLSGVREVLSSSPYTARLFRENAETFRPGYISELEGDYLVDYRSDKDEVLADMAVLLPSNIAIEDLSSIRCKK